MNTGQKIFAYREFFFRRWSFKKSKIVKNLKNVSKKTCGLVEKKYYKTIYSKKRSKIFFDNFLSHVLVLAERLKKIEKFMTIDWTNIHENQFKFRIDIKLFFFRLVKHNLDANILIIAKIRNDRKRLIVKIINMKKKIECWKINSKKRRKK